MALQSSDLFVVQQGQVVKSVDYATLSSGVNSQIEPSDLPIATASELGAIRIGANLNIDPNTGVLEAVLPAAVEYQGNVDPTQPAPAAQAGQAWLVSPAGVFDASFQNLAGQQGNVGDVVIYEGHPGSEWDLISGLFGMGVLSVRGQDPIEVDSSDASNPVVRIKPASDTQDGSMSAADKAKLDAIQDGADVGTVTEVTASLPLEVLDGTTEPKISVKNATAAATGVVRLADSTAITNGTSERVVDAAQLKVVSDSVETLELKVDNLSLYNFLGDDPIEVNVDANDNVTYSIKDASDSQKGAARFATDAEAGAGTDIATMMNPATVASHYLVNDFTKLQSV